MSTRAGSLPDRARKPGLRLHESAPAAKRRKTSSATSVPANVATCVQHSKQQLRISDLLAADRAAKAQRSLSQPAIINAPPDMDSRRPKPLKPSRQTALETKTTTGSVSQNGLVRQQSFSSDTQASRMFCEKSCPHYSAHTQSSQTEELRDSESVLETKSRVSKIRASGALHQSYSSMKISTPGTEAMQFDRSLLPDKHSILLDILGGIEQAMNLLASRKAVPQFSAVKKIVCNATKRTFNLRHLSQIAAIVPEAVAVLAPVNAEDIRLKKRGVLSSSLIIRLDDVAKVVDGTPCDWSHDDSESPDYRRAHFGEKKSSKRYGSLGETFARSRRRLLHRRLLWHVRSCHTEFLDCEKIRDFNGVLWHSEFSFTRHVPDLPAPPLYPAPPPIVSADSVMAENSRATEQALGNQCESTSSFDSILSSLTDCDKSVVDSQEAGGTNAQCEQGDSIGKKTVSSVERQGNVRARQCDARVDSHATEGVSVDLLNRVRVRQAMRERQAANSDVMQRSLLRKRLPSTMDAARSILANGRRSAMGWTALVSAIVAMHPEKWDAKEIERQLDAIANEASSWCEKKPLPGPRGGFSFRIIGEEHFAEARTAIHIHKGDQMESS